MEIFWLLFIFFAIIGLFTQNIRNQTLRRRRQAICAGFGLWIIQALRSPLCGVDLISDDPVAAAGYIPTFMAMDSYSVKELLHWSANNMETGWLLYNKLISLFTHDIQLYLAITAALPIILISYTIYKHSVNIIFSFYVFACFGLYHFSFSGLRQATALAITFFAYNFLYEKRPYKFIALVLLASTFHTSSILFLGVLFLRNRELKSMKGIIYVILILLLTSFLRTIVPFITQILYGSERYESLGDEGGAITMFFIYIAIFIGSYFIGGNINREREMYFLRWMALLSAMFQSLGFISTGSITRIAYYFLVFYLLFFPAFIYQIRDPRPRRAIMILVVLFLVVFHYMVNNSGYLNVIPYHFFWEERILL